MASKTRADIRDFARTLLGESTAARWSDAELNNYINDGLEQFCLRTDCLEDISTDSSVQYKADYAVPTDATRIKQVRFIKGNSEYLLIPFDVRESWDGLVKTTSNTPEGYLYYGEYLRLSERPSEAAAYTTLSAAIATDSATTLTLTDGTSFPRAGRLIIDDEVIEYWMNDAGSVSVATRGAEGTTAATHAKSATVTLRNIWIYHNKKETLSSDTQTPTIPTMFHEAPAWYSASIARHKSKDYDLAAQYMQEFDKFTMQGIEWAKGKWKRSWVPK